MVNYTITHGGNARTNIVRCVVMAPAAATSGRYYDVGTPTLRNVWVDSVGGNDTTGNGELRTSAYKTINRAWTDLPGNVRFATTGYRIMLCPGNYTNDKAYMDYHYGTYDYPLVFMAADGPGTVFIKYDMQFFSCNFLYFMDINTEPSNEGDGLHFDSCEYVYVKDCVIKGGPGVQRLGKEGLKVNQCEYVYLEDTEICNAWDNALDFMCVRYGHVRGCKIHDSGDWAGYAKGGSSDIVIESNEFYNGGNGGFTAGQGAGSEYFTAPWIHYQASNIKFINNVIHDCAGAGIGVNGGYNILFAYNTLYKVGSISHGIEVTFGNTGLDNTADQSIADTYKDWGGWMSTSTSNEERIPDKNIYIYNNILYNPMPYRSAWQHFLFSGPWNENTNTNIPKPAVTDKNLYIRGNILWNGPPNLNLGIDESSGCQPSNPTCNAALLAAGNHINDLEPQLTDPAHGDFRPLSAGNVFGVHSYDIQSFPGGDGPVSPQEPVGDLSNLVSKDFLDASRVPGGPPGAYAIGNAPVFYNLTMAVSPALAGTTTPPVGTHSMTSPSAITATAATGYYFVNWTVTAGTATVISPSSASTGVTFASDCTITANFAVIPAHAELTMAVLPAPGGTTNPTTGAHTVNTQEAIAISATPNTGYNFVNWTSSGRVTIADQTNANTSATLLDAATITANFIAIQKMTYGSYITITPENIGMPEGSAFGGKPSPSVDYQDITKTPPKDKTTKLTAMFDKGHPESFDCIWSKKVLLFNKKNILPSQTAAIYIPLVQTGHLPFLCELRVKAKAEGGETAEHVYGDINLVPPTIGGIFSDDAYSVPIISATPGVIIYVEGTYFGTKAPKVWLEYQVTKAGGNVVKTKTCKIMTPYVYQDYKGVAGKSCMDLSSPAGLSRMAVQVPGRLPSDWDIVSATEHNIVIDNGIGRATFIFDVNP